MSERMSKQKLLSAIAVGAAGGMAIGMLANPRPEDPEARRINQAQTILHTMDRNELREKGMLVLTGDDVFDLTYPVQNGTAKAKVTIAQPGDTAIGITNKYDDKSTNFDRDVKLIQDQGTGENGHMLIAGDLVVLPSDLNTDPSTGVQEASP